MTAPALRLAMVAGEASGDLLASLLMDGLQQRWPQARLAGIGGPQMKSRGFDAWWPSDKLAVRGYVEVLRHYREIKGIRDALAQRLLVERPAAFIGVDAPDFNLGLEATLRGAGIKTIHFVCPSIWAWRGERARKMAVSCDHVLCLFPFEPALLQAQGVAASYVGHPLADAIPMVVPRVQARAALGLSAHEPVVAILPGSRRSEIHHIAPTFLQAAQRLQRDRPGMRFLLPIAPGLRDMLAPLLRRHAHDVQITLLDGQSHAALAACDATLIASGTATLEAALFKRPMVIGYRMNPLTWQMMKRMRYQPWVGLPNILCREFVVPEFIQEACQAEVLAHAVGVAIDDASGAARLHARFAELHEGLRCDTASRASEVVAAVLEA